MVASAPPPVSAALPPVHASVSLEDLPGQWQAMVCDLLCEGASGLQHGPALPGRIRGALGQALLQGASPQARSGAPCPWSPPCALDGLFRDQGRLTPGLSIAKPWLIETFAQEDPSLLAVRLTLFGAAADLWMPAASEALVVGLRGGLTADRGRRIILEPVERRIAALPAPTMPAITPTAVVMRFRTPVVQRRGDLAGLDAVSLLTGLGNRLSGLARWMGLGLTADWKALKTAATALQTDASDLDAVQWDRRSSRQKRGDIPMAGFQGDLSLSGPLAPLLPLLVLGAQTHAGSHAALGLGAYDLLMMA